MDSECTQFLQCNADNICEHKDFLPLDTQEYFIMSIQLVLLTLAISSGIGGGIITIPMLVQCLNFEPKAVVSISIFVTLTASGTKSIQEVFERHPTFDRPLIDYNLLVSMNMAIFIGVTFGVFLNQAVTTELFYLMQIVLMVQMIQDTFSKANKLRKKHYQNKQTQLLLCSDSDTQDKDQVKYKHNINPDYTLELIKINNEVLNKINEDTNVTNNQLNIDSDSEKEDLIQENLLQQQKQTIDMSKFKYLLFFLIIVTINSFLRGTRNHSQLFGITYFSYTSQLIWSANITMMCFLLQKYNKVICDEIDIFSTRKEKFIQTKSDLQTVYLQSFFGGVFSGCLGMGAGMITANALLAIKIHPRAMSATASFRIFCNNVVTLAQYAFLGSFNVQWFIGLGVLGVIAGLLSKKVIFKIIDQYKLDQMIVYILGFIITIGTVGIGLKCQEFIFNKNF